MEEPNLSKDIACMSEISVERTTCRKIKYPFGVLFGMVNVNWLMSGVVKSRLF